MIRSLRIENFALIDSVNIQFEGGFTVITGETKPLIIYETVTDQAASV